MTEFSLTEEQLIRFEQRLLAEKANLSHQSQSTINAMMEDDTKGGDSLDRTTAEQTTSTLLRLKDRKLRRLFDIEAALRRLTENSFGYCETCGEPIGILRLEANPSAANCVDCQNEIDEETRRNTCRPGLLDDPHRF